jgi:hypothetical protein
METEDPKPNRRKLGGAARLLTVIAVLVNVVGLAALGMTVYPIALSLMLSGFPLGDFTSYIVVGFSMAFTPMIKFFPGVMMPLIAQAILRVGNRRAGAGILLVSGAITIPPIIIGGSLLLDPLLAAYGILPLLPHIVGGALLVAAGILALLWTPPPMAAPSTFVSITAQPSLTIRTEPQVREVILVICPYCGTKNPQGTTRCSNCDGRL